MAFDAFFAHGQHDKTFKRGGSLDKFPEDLKITKEANTKACSVVRAGQRPRQGSSRQLFHSGEHEQVYLQDCQAPVF